MADVGRPSAYLPEYAEKARKLCLLGADDKQLADFFEVCEATINNWKIAHPDFLESINKGKDLADAEVADKLYQRALGYSHPAVKIFSSAGEVTEVAYTEHYPPDTQAASLWLRNRQPKKWRDKTEIDQTTTLKATVIAGDMSAEDAAKVYKEMMDGN